MARDPESESGEPPITDEFADPGAESRGDEPKGTAERLVRFARRLLDRRELAEDTKELITAVLTTSDKAKTEAVRMVAREVRNYLSELRLKDDLMEQARSHSLEISLSMHLKPLAQTSPPPDASADPPSPGPDDPPSES
ncbi:MAG: hypothetical protein AAFU79_27340 [Myxococcota bacterium]